MVIGKFPPPPPQTIPPRQAFNGVFLSTPYLNVSSMGILLHHLAPFPGIIILELQTFIVTLGPNKTYIYMGERYNKLSARW
jgi:hypothetical protein